MMKVSFIVYNKIVVDLLALFLFSVLVTPELLPRPIITTNRHYLPNLKERRKGTLLSLPPKEM